MLTEDKGAQTHSQCSRVMPQRCHRPAELCLALAGAHPKALGRGCRPRQLQQTISTFLFSLWDLQKREEGPRERPAGPSPTRDATQPAQRGSVGNQTPQHKIPRSCLRGLLAVGLPLPAVTNKSSRATELDLQVAAAGTHPTEAGRPSGTAANHAIPALDPAPGLCLRVS